MEDELKQRAAFYLKQVSDTSKAATKTAFVSFAALAIIWFTQISPQYDRLLNYVYPSLPKLKQQLNQEKKKLSSSKADLRKTKPTPIVDQQNKELVAIAEQVPTESLTKAEDNFERAQDRVEKQQQAVKIKRSELENAVTNVSFDVFGLKIPVTPLLAAVVWNLVLLTVLLYLARARSSIWALCADALFTLKRSGRKPNALDDIAGNGPLWLAPAPTRPGKEQVVTANDLRSAFGWNHLETLPSIAATTGFLLLSLLQLAVTAQGYHVISSAREFTTSLTTVEDPATKTAVERPEILENKIASIASTLAQPDRPDTEDPTPTNSYDLKRQVRSLTVGKFLGSVISLFLLLTLMGMLILIVWWFRPGRVPGRLAGYTATPQQRAKFVLLVAAIIALCLILSAVRPDWGLRLGEKLSDRLPTVTIFLGGAIISFCLIELASLALFRPGGSKRV